MIEEYYKKFKVRDYMDDVVLREQSLVDIIDCSLGTNDFIDENIIKKYIIKSNYELNKYPIIEYDLLKEELINYWREYIGTSLTEDNIAFGGGIMGILRSMSEFLFNQNTNILGCAPQFPRFISEVELKKANYEYYDISKEDNFKFCADSLRRKISNKYDVIHIENPNNPTGQIIDIQEIEKIVSIAQTYNIIVIIDEAYGEYMNKSNSAIKLVKNYDNIVVLRSASKFYGLPNHRVGYLFSSKEFVKIYNEIAIPFPFSDLSANVYRNIIKNHKEMDSTKQEVMEIKKKMLKALRTENYLYTSIETPIFTVKSNKYENLSNELRKRGIIAENCTTFLNLDSRYARLRIPIEWKKLLSILVDIL